MRNYFLLLIAILILSTSCNKNVADYNIRDLNAGHLIGNWAYDMYYGEDYPDGLEVSKTPALQDDKIIFRAGGRDGLVAIGTGTISQGDNIFFPGKARDIDFTWRMDPDAINTVIIEVWDADHNLIGGNIANVDGSNNKLSIISSFKILVENGQRVKKFYSTSYYCHQLPW
jgi:hypothetical protein